MSEIVLDGTPVGFVKSYDYPQNGHMANTLSPSDIGTHADGWTIEGKVWSDYYEWVNEFTASHPTHGKVWGDFEKKVFAESQAGFDDFVKHHPPSEWDYWDI